MRIFIDTNVLVDMMDRSRPSHAASKMVLRAAEDGRITLLLTGMTLVNALYALRRAGLDQKKRANVVGIILSIAEVASTDMPQLQAALNSSWSDFEDAVQYHAALSAGRVQYIVTSDRNGFKGSRIPVLTPEKFVATHLSGDQ